MRKGISRYAVALAMALTLWVGLAAVTASAKPAGNPTPCFSATYYPTQQIVMGGDIVNVNFKANAYGFQGNCLFSFTSSLNTSHGSSMDVVFYIRTWQPGSGTCGEKFVRYGPATNSGSSVSWSTPSIAYGPCGKQADNYGTRITIGLSSYMICYLCYGYESFNG